MKSTQFIKSIDLLFFLALIAFMFGCNDPTQNDPKPDSELSKNGKPWYELIDQYDLNPGIIVQDEASLQNAIDIASTGDVIYIVPGIYSKSISIEKSSIRFVGLSNGSNERVIIENPGLLRSIDLPEGVKFDNIQFRNYQINSQNNYTDSDARKIKRRHLLEMTREEISNGIVHYKFDVRMGEGEFDVVTLHRVVQERIPYHPMKTKGDIFMVHGASQNFTDIFHVAGAAEINETTSAPFYLASQNIDVWGIDLAWTNVPIETADFGFMEGWGLEKDIDHTLMGMFIARIIRGITGQSFKKMNLMGFSYGVGVAYGAAGRETQMFHILKNVKGIIPVDSQLKSDDMEYQNGKCMEAGNFWDQIAMGNYAWPQGVGFIGLGQAVLADPEGTTLNPPLTNIQFLSAIASDHSNGSHFLGGTPFELNYTDPYRFARLAADLSGPYMPNQTVYEFIGSGCPSIDVSFDDHLMDIDVPILHISAEGGSGTLGDYTSTLTQTSDYTWLNIDDPTVDPELDFGHADLWMAYQAAEWVWEPLRNWLYQH